MGIQGLLSFLRPATEEIHIKEYSGKTVAVDTYCWLHRGSFACADKLAKGEPTDQYVKYCMKFINMLLVNGVKPILVFDGCHLPSKKEVEKQRSERRKQYMEIGKKFLREGKTSQARDAFTKCVSVTHNMALDVMKAARARGVDCIVAPYEADSQLAYLLKEGYAEAVITEDSDLLCFGCEKVLFKLDLAGRAQQICMENLGSVKNLVGFTAEMLRHMCILSGCDYLPSIKGVGLVKSCNAIKMAKSKNIYDVVRKLHQYIKGLSPVEATYSVGFEKAEKTFKYQLVMDPKQRKLVPLNQYEEDVEEEDLSYAGPLINDEKALDIAIGNVNVNNGKKVEHFEIDIWLNEHTSTSSGSIWHGDNSNYKPGSSVTATAKPMKSKHNEMFKSHKNEKTIGKEKTIKFGNLFARAKKKPKAKQFTNEEVLAKLDMGDDVDEEEDNEIVVNNSQSNVVVKSRFFHKAKPLTSKEDEDDRKADHDTVHSPHKSPHKKNTDHQLNSILDELNKDSNNSPLTGWISSGKNPRKRKRSVNSSLQTAYKEYCKENEIRTPLKSPRKSVVSNSTDVCTSSPPTFTPKKRLSAVSMETRSPVRKSPRKPHRKVLKPPNDDAAQTNNSISTEESIPILDKEAVHEPLDVSTESIPIIDGKRNKFKSDIKNMQKDVLKPCEVSLEDCLVTKVLDEQTITVSSDEENQDFVTKKQSHSVKHKITSNHHSNAKSSSKRTSLKASGKKSKYFTGTKASGLRKTSKSQPTIFSLFKKHNDKTEREMKKPLSELPVEALQNREIIEI